MGDEPGGGGGGGGYDGPSVMWVPRVGAEPSVCARLIAQLAGHRKCAVPRRILSPCPRLPELPFSRRALSPASRWALASSTCCTAYLGRGRNWGAVARHLQVRRPDWQSVADRSPPARRLARRSMRRTPWMPAQPTVARLEGRYAHEPRAVLGHSFGGKVALALRRTNGRAPAGLGHRLDARREGAGGCRVGDARTWSSPAHGLRVAGRRPSSRCSRAGGPADGRVVDGHEPADRRTARYRGGSTSQAVGALLEDFFRHDLVGRRRAAPAGRGTALREGRRLPHPRQDGV